MSRIVKFLERHRKASDERNPFPWDRVFVSSDEMSAFGDELMEFCEGYEHNMEELEQLREQMRGMNV